MRSAVAWSVIGIVIAIIAGIALIGSPAQTSAKMVRLYVELRVFPIVVHVLFLATVVLGLRIKKARSTLFSGLIIFICLSATILAILYRMLPHTVAFGLLSVLSIRAALRQDLEFSLSGLTRANYLFGAIGILFGFLYMHRATYPIWMNVLFYAPIGGPNCSTPLVVSGFLCLAGPRRSALLEAAAGVITICFGFFGLLRLGALVDVTLIACGLYLLIRIWRYKQASRQRTLIKVWSYPLATLLLLGLSAALGYRDGATLDEAHIYLLLIVMMFIFAVGGIVNFVKVVVLYKKVGDHSMVRYLAAGLILNGIVIAIPISKAIGDYMYRQSVKRHNMAVGQIHEIQHIILEEYAAEHGAYPSETEGLDAIRDHFYDERILIDPWGRPYGYRLEESPGMNGEPAPYVWSCGPDGIPGTGDDIDAKSRRIILPYVHWPAA